MKWLMNLYKGAESNSSYKVLGNTPDESSKYPGDDEKWKNGDNFDKNVEAKKHRAEIEEMIAK